MVEKRCFFKNAGPVWIYPILLYKRGLRNLVVVGVFVCFFVIVFFLSIFYTSLKFIWYLDEKHDTILSLNYIFII